MGHVVRRVPLNWEHPKDSFGAFIPLHDGHHLAARQADWDLGESNWNKGLAEDFRGDWVPRSRDQLTMSYEDWSGKRPDHRDHTPEWAESERVGWMMYEDITEGTPLSPVFDSPIKLAAWLDSDYTRVRRPFSEWLSYILAPYERQRYRDSRNLKRKSGMSDIIQHVRKNTAEIYRHLVPKTGPVNDELTRRTLHSEVSTMAHHLITGLLIWRATVVCDERNNPPTAVESGFPNLNLAIQFMGGETYAVDIGPDAAAFKNGITWEQVYA